MADVNALIASPTVPNALAGLSGGISAANSLTQLRQQQAEQETMQAAGSALSQGDHDSAAQILMQAGKIDAANAVKAQGTQIKAGQLAASGDYNAAARTMLQGGYFDQASKIKSEGLSDLNDAYKRIANVAMLNPTPDQWNATVNTLEQHGFPVPQPCKDPITGPKLAIALANQVQDYNKNLLEQRNAQTADLKAGLVRDYTLKSADGHDIPGTVRIDPATGQPDMKTFTLKTAGGALGESAAPSEMNAGKESGAAAIQGAKKLQEDYKKANGDDLDFQTASSAYRNGQIVVKGPDGKPKSVSPEGTTSYARTAEGNYERTYGGKAAAQDVSVAARKQLGSVIDEHATHLADISNRPEFNQAMMFLHTPEGLQFLEGKALPAGTQIPKTAVDLKQTIDSVSGEYNNFVSQGHKGSLHAHEATVLSRIGQSLYNAPDPETFRSNIDNIKVLASAFQHVKPVGPVSEWGKGQQQTPTAPSQQSAAPRPVGSKADYDALPSGAEFIAPDGSHRRKP